MRWKGMIVFLLVKTVRGLLGAAVFSTTTMRDGFNSGCMGKLRQIGGGIVRGIFDREQLIVGGLWEVSLEKLGSVLSFFGSGMIVIGFVRLV